MLYAKIYLCIFVYTRIYIDFNYNMYVCTCLCTTHMVENELKKFKIVCYEVFTLLILLY